MSSNIPLINSTEDKNQDNIGNLKTDNQKASYSYFGKTISEDIEKYMVLNKLPSLDKSRSSSKTETEDTVKLNTKNDQYHQPVQMIKNMKEQQPKVITIKTNKLTRDNKSLLSVSVLGESITTVSLDEGRIPRKKKK